MKATDFSTRIFQAASFQLSPFIHLDIDELPIGRTTTKYRNSNPTFNEEFNSEVHSGHTLNFTVFHDAALPPDEFVANCSMTLDKIKTDKDVWVDLEPHGKLHFTIELEGELTEGKI